MANEQPRRSRRIVLPPPLIYLGPLALGLLLGKAVPLPFLPRGLSRFFGWPILGGGVLLAWWFGRTLRRAGTTVRIDRSVSRLVTSGPSRHSRNSGYLSFTMIYAGIATSGRSPSRSFSSQGRWQRCSVPSSSRRSATWNAASGRSTCATRRGCAAGCRGGRYASFAF